MVRNFILLFFAFSLLLSRHAATQVAPPTKTAQAADVARGLQLVPAPKEVQMLGGGLAIGGATHIYLSVASAAEDRTAAEMLQEEIHQRADFVVPIEVLKTAPSQRGNISLGRLTDPGLRAYLKQIGVQTQDLGDQGYVIRATRDGILVAGTTGQGLFYGVQTLRQLLRPQGKALQCPFLVIRDWPTMPWRGVHDDISRGPIPNLVYMKQQIRTLSEYKINLFALYMEHVFDYQSQPLLAPRDAALTPREIHELVEYGKKYFVTLLPEQQAFGHLHHALKYEVYSELAETPHGHVLTPINPKTYDFIRSVYDELVPLFPGPFLHIGGDETAELGRGQSKALAEQQGLGRVYLEHLQKVEEIMRPYHKQLMFWGDIALHYPQLLSILPKDMIAVPWEYDPLPSFDDQIKPFSNAGLRVMVAPGANNWNQIWPDLDAAYVNIRNFVRDGQKYNAIGMVNTTWRDDGETLFDMTWPALTFGATAAWQSGEANIEDFKNSYDWAFYRNEDTTFRDVLDNLDRVHAALRAAKTPLSTDELFWQDYFTEPGANIAQRVSPATHDLRLAAEHAIEGLQHDSRKARLHRETLEDMLFAAWRIDALGMKVQYAKEINASYWDAFLNQADPHRVENDFAEISDTNGRLEDLRDVSTRLRADYEKAWLRENRPYWLGNVLVRYDAMAIQMQSKAWAMHDAYQQYSLTKTLPAPERMGMYWKP